ncbi:4-hydroxyphenylacetate decarboxylase large subunit [uncultured Roseburia sp.]|uniref:Formate C-acetyltransferase n=1 Tax=Brotonthovivens ammoniilytica TaxID=2981725 RepID=A0ABT2TF89_9FIRM|nr:pyruvate formate lyase family protein [Brotonthovivens ammoniilytica]MCU6760852.1 hypothetical protein [Brotonthovivens ammoniilytica]SCI11225.1 4-hydroxyphenylacetate decarboxylase large subunit [uncultured Roseburia sp.]
MGTKNTEKQQNTKTRGQILWERLRPLRDTEPVSFERAWLVTQSYKETEGMPVFLRRAAAYENVMKNIPIYLDEGQLLAGDFASRPMCAEIFPEMTVAWIKEYMENGDYDNQPDEGWYTFEHNRKEQINEICDYWTKNAARESFYRYLGEEEVQRLYEENEAGAWIYAASTEAQTEKGWNIPDYSRVLKKGLKGLLEEVENTLAETPIVSDESLKERTFLEALKSMLKSAVHYAHRYADLCRELAKEAKGERKQELLQMAEICDWVPENPARTFQEAVQSMWFCHIMIYWDSRTIGLGFGRVDQYLYPYYKKDIEEGRIDREYATQILECLRVKLSSKRNVFNVTIRAALSNDSHFHNCTIGGQTTDGQDAVNELSFLWLDAAERVRTPHPTISVRWHEKINQKFALRCLEIVKLGMGFPAFFNDTPTIEYLLERGVTLKEARDYAIGGCVLHNVVGKTPTTWPDVMNFAKLFELALNDGMDPRTGKQFGLHTGKFTDFETYEDVVEAYKKQILFFMEKTTEYLNKVSIYRGEMFPETFVSLFFDDCIKKKKSINQGGAKYLINCYYVIPVGVVDVANSLIVLKNKVFGGDKSIGKQELMDALAANFEGYDDLWMKVDECPDFGNDVPEVDEIAAELYEWMCDEIPKFKGGYGVQYEVAPHSIAFHANMGLKVGALPSGRKAALSLADGAVSPNQGSDVNGPSAVVNSAGRIDHTRIFGTLFNMKFMPAALATTEDRKKLLALIKTYFGTYGGKHIQFNVVDRDVLIDAKAHPENHRDLIVRIAGYSALWCELNESIQDELIARTENTL